MDKLTKRSVWQMLSLDSALDWWRALDHRYKTAFGILLAVNLFVFLYGMIQYPLKDHDLLLFDKVRSEFFVPWGRWFSPVLAALHFKLTIPVYMQFLAIVMQILAAMAMILLWHPEARRRHLVLGGLLVSLNPFLTDSYHFQPFIHHYAFAQMMMVGALMLSVKGWRWPYLGLGTLFVCFALATYPPAAQTFAVGWAGLLCLRISRWDGRGQSLKENLKPLMPAVLVALLGGILFVLSIVCLKYTGKLVSDYQLETRSASEMLRAFKPTLSMAFQHLWLTQTYSPKSLKILLLIITIWGSLALFLKRDGLPWLRVLTRSVLLIVAVIFMFFCSKFLFILNPSAYFAARLAIFGLSFIYLFFALAVLTSRIRPFREICAALLLCIVFPLMAVINLRAQETYVRMEQHDFAVANRVLNRLESELGDELYRDDLIVVKFGEWESLMNRLNPLTSHFSGSDFGHFQHTLIRLNPEKFLQRLSASFNPAQTFAFDNMNSAVPSNEIEIKAAHMTKGLEAYPAKNFFTLEDNLLVVVLNKKSADAARASLAGDTGDIKE